mmetsp:Transcript_105169/g.307407  ORF Transcript_105169/g.307407 Transcript_105169/m.307407 type:complete len:169 (-) Transcript_105169:1433-1939(-)
MPAAARAQDPGTARGRTSPGTALEAKCGPGTWGPAAKEPCDGSHVPQGCCPSHGPPAPAASNGAGRSASSTTGSAMYLNEVCERGSGQMPFQHGAAVAGACGTRGAAPHAGSLQGDAAVENEAAADTAAGSAIKPDSCVDVAVSSTRTWESSREEGTCATLFDGLFEE